MSHCTQIATRICEHWERADAAEYRGARGEADGFFQALIADTDRLSRLSAGDLRDLLAQIIVVADALCAITEDEQSEERRRMVANALDRFIRSAVPVLEKATGAERPRCLNRYVDFHVGGETDDTSLTAIDGDEPEAANPAEPYTRH